MPWVCFAVTEQRKTWKNNDHLSSRFFVLTTYLTSSVIYYWIDARSLRVAVAFPPPPPQGETRRLTRTVMTSDQNVNHWHHQQSFSRTPLTRMITHAPPPPPPLFPPPPYLELFTHTGKVAEKKKELLRQSLFPAFFQSYKFSLTQS